MPTHVRKLFDESTNLCLRGTPRAATGEQPDVVHRGTGADPQQLGNARQIHLDIR